jgi:hypothetical protein
VSIAFLLNEKRDVVAGGSGGERSGGARNLLYPAARSNSGRAAPSACVGKRFSAAQIIWNRSAHRRKRRGAGRQAQMAEDFDDHRRIFDGCPERVEGAAMIFKAPPQLGHCSMSMSKTRLSSRAQLMRGVSPWAAA